MNKSHKNLIRERYENAVHEYCIAFCQKHDYHYNPDGWVRNNIGGVVLIGDYYINFDDIRYDIDNDVPKEIFFEFYEYTLRLAMIDEGRHNVKHVNYPHYIMGFRPYSEAQLKKMEEAKKRVEEAEEALRECLAAQTDEMDFINREGEE